MMRHHRWFIIFTWIAFFLTASCIADKQPVETLSVNGAGLQPLAVEDMTSVEEKLHYLLTTDRADRTTATYDQMKARDITRTKWVYGWYRQGLLDDWQEQFLSGVLLMRAGAPYLQRTDMLFAAYDLFRQAAKGATDDKVKEECILLAGKIAHYLNQLDTDRRMHCNVLPCLPEHDDIR